MNRAAPALALALLLCAACALAQAPKSQRLALVIGNGAYQDAPLANPVNDAADMAKALEASGFTVMKRENATLREMHLALREFGDRLGRQSTGLFYFAGHGMQVRGRNYLLPVDADIAREDEVAFAALDLGAVMEKLDSAKNPVNIVVLDACRNNPFGTRLQATAKGLAQVDAPPGTLIAFATAPGSTAADGGGRNGLYTHHLVRQIDRPGLAIEEVFKAVRASVRTESKNLQVPWESTSLESNFFFRAKPAEPVKAAAARPDGKTAAPSRPRAAAPASPPSFTVGDRWAYRIVNLLDGSERRSQLSVKDIQGDEIHFTNGNIADAVGNNIRVTRTGGRIETYQPSNYFYVFPLKAGNAYTFKVLQEVEGRKTDLTVKLKVVGEEEVDTPLGKMRALRLERESRWKERERPNGGVRTWTYWYNGGVKRFVLAEDTNVATGGKLLSRERYELVEYDVK